MWIGAILHLAALLAFADGASFLEDGDGSGAQRANRWPPFLRQQHRRRMNSEFVAENLEAEGGVVGSRPLKGIEKDEERERVLSTGWVWGCH